MDRRNRGGDRIVAAGAGAGAGGGGGAGAPPLPMAVDDDGVNGAERDDWGVVTLEDGAGGTAAAAAGRGGIGISRGQRQASTWREREIEREQRQRSVRFMMMLLLMMLLMDDGNQNGQQQQQQHQQLQTHLRKRQQNQGLEHEMKFNQHQSNTQNQHEKQKLGNFRSPMQRTNLSPKHPRPMDRLVYEARRSQDERIVKITASHPRYQRLVAKNNGKDYDSVVRGWAYKDVTLGKVNSTTQDDNGSGADDDEDDENGEGENDGDDDNRDGQIGGEDISQDEKKVAHYPWNSTGLYRGNWEKIGHHIETQQQSKQTGNASDYKFLQPVQIERAMLDTLISRGQSIGIHVLPTLTRVGRGFNMTDSPVTDNGHVRPNKTKYPGLWWWLTFWQRPSDDDDSDESSRLELPLTQSAGQASFQLSSRSVPAINEISLLEGYFKLYDSKSIGYSTQRDVLIRVSGVLVHSIGRISLVSTPLSGRSALVLENGHPSNSGKNDVDTEYQRRRLRENIESIVDENGVRVIRDEMIALVESDNVDLDRSASIVSLNPLSPKEIEVPTSNIVFPYPFVPDDNDRVRGKGKLEKPTRDREKQFESNAGLCEFEITMDVKDELWRVGQWKDLVRARIDHTIRLDPNLQNSTINRTAGTGNVDIESMKARTRMKTRLGRREDEALVMAMNGTIYSPNCNFFAAMNVSAIRTDWNQTMRKGVNYSFVMMLTCLTQIVLLLRQLLHTQAQSAAIRISLLCIGWQTVLDALLCLTHIYLSLAMKPLFTAFASVAFFKLLIFCVIEMKYMALLIQARNSNSGGVAADVLRRQVAMLHLRCYLALVGSFLAFFYAGDAYRIFCLFILYSFWVPQIVRNIITEAKRPMHKYYIYGMSMSRLVAPLYAFGVKQNFLADAYRINTADPLACQMLIFWVGIQTAILIGQSHHGARFMIPSRFLPPKFDYSRPIPDSLMVEASSSGSSSSSPSVSLERERSAERPNANVQPLVPRDTSPHNRPSAGVTRNRMKGSRATRLEGCMTAETVSSEPVDPSLPRFDCVICYNPIDIRNRGGYMLAPCNHLFHKDCLVQWMEVKMECPICRTDLPAL